MSSLTPRGCPQSSSGLPCDVCWMAVPAIPEPELRVVGMVVREKVGGHADRPHDLKKFVCFLMRFLMWRVDKLLITQVKR